MFKNFRDRIKKWAKKYILRRAQNGDVEPSVIYDYDIEEPVEITPDFAQNFVSQVRQYFENINPADPLNSLLPPFPEKWKSSQLSRSFIMVANQVLDEKGLDERNKYEIINTLLGTRQLIESSFTDEVSNFIRTSIDPENPDISSLPNVNKEWLEPDTIGQFQSIAREILSSEPYNMNEMEADSIITSMMEPRVEGKERFTGLPEDLLRRIVIKNVNEKTILDGLASLDRRLGKGTYTLDSKNPGSDRYPVMWVSPQSQQFYDTFVSKDPQKREDFLAYCRKSKKDGGSGMVNSIINYLGLNKSLTEMQKGAVENDIGSLIWEFLATKTRIPFGRTENFDPNTGESVCIKDYLSNFFGKNPQYLPKGIKVEVVKSGKRTDYLFNGVNLCKSADTPQKWAIRDKLSQSVSSLIAAKNPDILDYVLNTMAVRIGNYVKEKRKREIPEASIDVPGKEGKPMGGGLSIEREKKRRDVAKQKIDKTQFGEEDIENAVTNRKLGIVIKEIGDENIFQNIYDNFGRETITFLSSEIENGVITNPSAVVKSSKVIDTLQAFMLLCSSQFDSFLSNSNFNNDDGKLHFDMKDGKVNKWNETVNKERMFNTFANIAEAKKIIANMNARFSKDPTNVAQNTAKQLRVKGITEETDPIVFTMLQDESFIRRSMLADPSLIDNYYKVSTKEVKRKIKDKLDKKKIRKTPIEINKMTYEALGKTLNESMQTMPGTFIPYAVSIIAQKENQIRQDFANEPEIMKSELQKLRKMQQIFGLAFPVHAEFKLDDAKWAERIRDAEKGIKRYPFPGHVNKTLTRMLNLPGGKTISHRDGYRMMVGLEPIPQNILRESSQMSYSLYKYGNSILENMIRSYDILDKFGLGQEIMETITQIGDDYRNRILSVSVSITPPTRGGACSTG